MTLGSVRSRRRTMSIEKPAVRTASKRIPAAVIDASSSRASTVRCSDVRSRSKPVTLSNSSGSTCPVPTWPVTSMSGSMIRRSEAAESRSIRSSTLVPVVAAGATGPPRSPGDSLLESGPKVRGRDTGTRVNIGTVGAGFARAGATVLGDVSGPVTAGCAARNSAMSL